MKKKTNNNKTPKIIITGMISKNVKKPEKIESINSKSLKKETDHKYINILILSRINDKLN